MRVVHAMAGAEFGGAEAFFENLVLGMSRAGLEQRVVIRRDARRAARPRAGAQIPPNRGAAGTGWGRRGRLPPRDYEMSRIVGRRGYSAHRLPLRSFFPNANGPAP